MEYRLPDRSGAVDFIEKRSSFAETKNRINLSLKKYIESSEVFQESTQSDFLGAATANEMVLHSLQAESQLNTAPSN